MANIQTELSNKKNINYIHEIVLEIRIWKKIIFNKIILLIFSSLIFGIIGIIYAKSFPPLYTANMKFMLKADANGGLSSSLSSLSSMLGGSNSSNGNPLERILELVGSERIVNNALFRKATINNSSNLLINHFMVLEKLDEKWKVDTILNKVKFDNSSRFDNLNFSQRKAIKKITNLLTGRQDLSGGIISKNFNKKSGIVTISAQYKNETFAIELTNAIYNELIAFYIDQSIYTTNNNVQILLQKVDSIKTALKYTQNQLASNTDKSLGLLLQRDKVESKSLAINEQMLILMYGEAQKNLETLRFIQASATPSFAIIDAPYSPIDPTKKSTLFSVLIGLTLPFVIIVSFFRVKLLFSI